MMIIKFFSRTTVVSALLGCASRTSAQPIHDRFNRDLGFFLSDEIQYKGNGVYCFNEVLDSVVSGPSTAHMLAMFNENHVMHDDDGRVFAVMGVRGFPWLVNGNSAPGLYEVIDQNDSCVKYNLIYPGGNMGLLVSLGENSEFSPIEIVAVDRFTKRIYGYYEDTPGDWKRKKTVWGYAADGSLAGVVDNQGSVRVVNGLHPQGWRIGLYGNFVNFNYSRDTTVKCAGTWPPATADSWGGKWGPFRGSYCADIIDKHVIKDTWHSSANGGSVETHLVGEPANKLSRLSHKSNIFGISSNNSQLLTLVRFAGEIQSMTIKPNPLQGGVDQVGGLGDEDDEGVYVTARGKLYYVYREDACSTSSDIWSWKAKEIVSIPYELCTTPVDPQLPPQHPTMKFGNHGGNAYFMYGTRPSSKCNRSGGHFYLYRLVNGDVQLVQEGTY
mmetsp:Transcript_23614/g.49457  ORF Transcript_23614/g.49457 Transcript_23614/m.49457 type:complete len:441 (-) Transcript_23614:71-1393(-)